MKQSLSFCWPVLLIGLSLTLAPPADASTGPKRPGESAVPPIRVTAENQHLFAETSNRLWEISRSIDSTIQERQQRDIEQLLQTLRERRAAKAKLKPMARLEREAQHIETRAEIQLAIREPVIASAPRPGRFRASGTFTAGQCLTPGKVR